MSRVKDVAKALEQIRDLDEITDESAREIHLALLGHIAACLAVIADKSNGGRWIKLHTVFGNEPVMIQVENISCYRYLGDRTVVQFVGGAKDNYLDIVETPTEIRELINEETSWSRCIRGG